MKMSSLKAPLTKQLQRGLLFIVTVVFIGTTAIESRADQMTTIRIQDRVEIAAGEVLLGQIANIAGNDVQLNQYLRGIVIGKAPSPGDSRRFSKDHVIQRLKQHHIDLTAVRVEAPQQVNVIRSHVQIQKQEFEKIVSDFILQHTPQTDTTMRIREIQVPKSLTLPKGRITYKAAAPRSRQLMGRCPISIDFSVDGRFEKKVWATAMVEVLGQVVVTRKPLGRYKPITEDDIEVRTLDLANLPANVLSDPAAAIGKRTKRAIGSQMPLRADHIELPPLVKRGDLVVIIAETESLKITTLGQVKKKGRLGELIPVVNLDSKKLLHARVMDANTVKVDF
jgi:flagella basal body P-ring formation protein FlgA